MTVYRIISAEKASGVPVSLICGLFEVSRSGYYEWATRAPSDRELGDAWLTEKIREIHAENRGVYGSPRIHAELRMSYVINVGRKRVERLMHEAGTSGLVVRKRGRTTVRVPGVRVADDLVERQFRPEQPDVLWIADFSYLRTWEGWLYLAAVQDAFSRRIVGWSMADHMREELVIDALTMALKRRRPDPGLIHHSDQGSQYVSLGFGQECQKAGISRSTLHARLPLAGRVRGAARWPPARGKSQKRQRRVENPSGFQHQQRLLQRQRLRSRRKR